MYTEILKAKIKEAMFAKDTIAKDVLRVVLGDIETLGLRQNITPTDEQGYKITRKIIESNNEVLANLSETDSRYEKLKTENQILEALLPSFLSVEDIRKILVDNVQIKEAKSDGQAIGVAMKALKAANANVQGNDVKEVVNELRMENK